MMSQSDADDESIRGDSAEAIEHKTRKALEVFAAESKKKSSYSHIKGYVFGPYITVTEEAKMCKRCGLFVPSEQTGNAIVSLSFAFNTNSFKVSFCILYFSSWFPQQLFTVYYN